MWNAAEIAHTQRHAQYYGLPPAAAGSVDWPHLKAGRDAYVARLNGIYESNLQKRGVKLFRGRAQLVEPRAVELNGARITAAHVAIATGGEPTIPALPGAELGITSDGFFELRHAAAVRGGGGIGLHRRGGGRHPRRARLQGGAGAAPGHGAAQLRSHAERRGAGVVACAGRGNRHEGRAGRGGARHTGGRRRRGAGARGTVAACRPPTCSSGRWAARRAPRSSTPRSWA